MTPETYAKITGNTIPLLILMIRKIFFSLSTLFLGSLTASAQTPTEEAAAATSTDPAVANAPQGIEDFSGGSDTAPAALAMQLQVGKTVYHGDSIPDIIMPAGGIWIYPPIQFESEKARQNYEILVRKVKKLLPFAKLCRYTIIETYDFLQTLPKSEREAHIKRVEDGLKRQYSPFVKKLTRSEGKLFVKLIDRECNMTGYNIAKAFVGAFQANIYQGVAFLFGQNLNKKYDPEGDDRYIERVCRLVEAGQI